jgi:murein DD-endopeptidase MepM/ murein hydrolase activator NlpD
MTRRPLRLLLGLVLALQGLGLTVAPSPPSPALGAAHITAPTGGGRTATAGGPVVSPAGLSPASRWQWPLEPAPAVVRRFRASPTLWGAGHRGVDLAARVGQPVLAAAAGVVTFAGVVAGRGVVAVTHAGGLRSTYEPVRGDVVVGARVSAGQPIGVVEGTPGHCSPVTCLHWGAVRGSGHAARYVDPLAMLGVDLSPPVLLPLR